jgi:hypothetical protein
MENTEDKKNTSCSGCLGIIIVSIVLTVLFSRGCGSSSSQSGKVENNYEQVETVIAKALSHPEYDKYFFPYTSSSSPRGVSVSDITVFTMLVITNPDVLNTDSLTVLGYSVVKTIWDVMKQLPNGNEFYIHVHFYVIGDMGSTEIVEVYRAPGEAMPKFKWKNI